MSTLRLLSRSLGKGVRGAMVAQQSRGLMRAANLAGKSQARSMSLFTHRCVAGAFLASGRRNKPYATARAAE